MIIIHNIFRAGETERKGMVIIHKMLDEFIILDFSLWRRYTEASDAN